MTEHEELYWTERRISSERLAEIERLRMELRCEQIRSEDRGASYAAMTAKADQLRADVAVYAEEARAATACAHRKQFLLSDAVRIIVTIDNADADSTIGSIKVDTGRGVKYLVDAAEQWMRAVGELTP